jgi:hypothetical protein
LPGLRGFGSASIMQGVNRMLRVRKVKRDRRKVRIL